MKKILLIAALAAGNTYATEVQFQWDDPAPEFAPLIEETRIYMVGNDTPIGMAPMPDNTVSVDLGTLDPKQYCFAAKHVSGDVESGFSNEVCINIPPVPTGLTTIQVTVSVEVGQ
jgi:hypothetical protein